jgi:quercetin dioxygenase-like cupin family protein
MEEKKKIGYGKRIVVIAEGIAAGGAVLEIEKGKQTDMVFHMKTDKAIYVMSGLLKVRVLKDGQVTTLNVKPGISFFVRAGLVHQFEAIEDSIVVEFVSDTALYSNSDESIVSLGTKFEETPETVQEGEFATMTPEDEAKVKKPKTVRKKRTPRKKKPTKKTKTTKRKRK